jgi:hypothetical protein
MQFLLNTSQNIFSRQVTSLLCAIGAAMQLLFVFVIFISNDFEKAMFEFQTMGSIAIVFLMLQLAMFTLAFLAQVYMLIALCLAEKTNYSIGFMGVAISVVAGFLAVMNGMMPVALTLALSVFMILFNAYPIAWRYEKETFRQ